MLELNPCKARMDNLVTYLFAIRKPCFLNHCFLVTYLISLFQLILTMVVGLVFGPVVRAPVKMLTPSIRVPGLSTRLQLKSSFLLRQLWEVAVRTQ